MSEEHESAQLIGNVAGEGTEALSALRGIWKAQGQTSAHLDEAGGNSNTCKNMESVGFQGLVDDVDTPTQGVSSNLRSAWKRKLEREGKLNTEARSVRDLVLGSPDQQE